MADNEARELIKILHEDHGTRDRELARVCGVTRQHINRIKQGHIGASRALYNRLEDLYYRLEDAGRKRKPYTWKTGKDIRKPRATRISLKPPQTLLEALQTPLTHLQQLRYKRGRLCLLCRAEGHSEPTETPYGSIRLCGQCQTRFRAPAPTYIRTYSYVEEPL